MPEKSCSIESTPMSASIRWRSACEFGIYLIYGRLLFFFAGVLVVFLSGHEVCCLVLVEQTNTDHPSIAVGIFVNFLGRRAQILVYLDHFSRYRNVELGASIDDLFITEDHTVITSCAALG